MPEPIFHFRLRELSAIQPWGQAKGDPFLFWFGLTDGWYWLTTTIADNEAKPVGNLYFAGEHTSSFYEWQGFMEGAALSGVRAAGEVYAALR